MELTKDQLPLFLDENTPRLKVAKSNALIEAQFELSALEHKLVLVAIAQIHKDQTRLKEFVFEVQDLAKLLGLNPKNAYRDLRKTSQGLMSKQVEIRDGKGNWELYQWVSKAWCKNGSFGLKLSDDLAPYLLNLVGKYTLYELDRILRIASGYAIRLFELFREYSRIGKRTVALDPEVAVQYGWDYFPKVMGYSPNSYGRINNLKQRVLDPAIAQLEKETEFKQISYRIKRFNRKAIAIEFSWKFFETVEELPQHPLFRDLIALGVTEQACRDVFNKYDEARIGKNHAYTRELHRLKKINNAPAFFMAAVKENYADPSFPGFAEPEKVVRTETASPRPDHKLYEKCVNDREFETLRHAEHERGEPFESYNEFHAYTLSRIHQGN